jgi:hypothetical protein
MIVTTNRHKPLKPTAPKKPPTIGRWHQPKVGMEGAFAEGIAVAQVAGDDVRERPAVDH